MVFFCAVLLSWHCERKAGIENFKINYKEGKAISVRFVINDHKAQPQFYLADQATAIFGQLSQDENTYLFEPVVPFTQGQHYEIRSKNARLYAFELPVMPAGAKATLKAIYPTKDSLPENLLKIYLQFDQPMQAVGNALDYITVIDQNTDEEVEVFLELESELWNKQHDRLTLWLDPGRIKTDLIPNREKGLPLLKTHHYTLSISKAWKTAKAISLAEDYTKEFVVVARDNSKPNPENWQISTPTADLKVPLEIDFKEPLDAFLALETISVLNEQDEFIDGSFELGQHENSILFSPVNNWKKGSYKILIDQKLEDLAGNNLGRLFDTDLKETDKKIAPAAIYKLNLSIQ